MKNIETEDLYPLAESILKKMITYEDSNKLLIFDRVPEWVSSLNNKEVMHIQNITGDLLHISTHIGSKTNNDEINNSRYENNNILFLVRAIDDLMDVWESIFDQIGIDNQESLLRKINYISSFVKYGLLESNGDKYNFFHKSLNEALLLLENYLYKFKWNGESGIDYLKLFFYKGNGTALISDLINNINLYLDSFSKQDVIDFFNSLEEILVGVPESNLNYFLENILILIEMNVEENVILESGEIATNEFFNSYEKVINYSVSLDEQNKTPVDDLFNWIRSEKNQDHLTRVMDNLLGKIE